MRQLARRQTRLTCAAVRKMSERGISMLNVALRYSMPSGIAQGIHVAPSLSFLAPRAIHTQITPLSADTAAEEVLEEIQEPEERPPAVDGAESYAFLLCENPQYDHFVNMIMLKGKKAVARRLLQETFVHIKKQGNDPQKVFAAAMENVRPMVEMRRTKTRQAGQVPYPLSPRRADTTAMRWIIHAARDRKVASGFVEKLSFELLQAAEGKGTAVGKRTAMHQLALANQAAAHFRWRVASTQRPGSVDLDAKQFKPTGRRAIRKLQSPI
eukprot:3005659-Pleurochrysis_carterae.AAC.3